MHVWALHYILLILARIVLKYNMQGNETFSEEDKARGVQVKRVITLGHVQLCLRVRLSKKAFLVIVSKINSLLFQLISSNKSQSVPISNTKRRKN